MSAIAARFSPAALNAYREAARARDKLFSLAVSGAFRSYGRRSVIQLPARLSGERDIVIGDDVFIGAASWLQVIGDDPDRHLTIGDGTSVSGHTVLSAAHSLTLGRKVLIARGV